MILGIAAAALVFLAPIVLSGTARAENPPPATAPTAPAGGGSATGSAGHAHDDGHGHGQEATVSTEPKLTENTRVDELIRQYVAEYTRWAPSVATNLGLHEHDADLEDRSRTAIGNREKELDSYRYAFQTVIESALDTDHRVDLLTIRHLIQRELFELTELRAWQTNPMYYTEILSNSVYELVAKRFASPESHMRALIAREALFARLVGQAKENLDNPPELFTREAIDLTRGTIRFLEKELPPITDQVLDDSLSQAFLDGNARAVEVVKDYLAFLETDLLPRSKGSFALGPDRFGRLLRVGGQFNAEPGALLELGEEELDKKLDLFKETAKAIPGKGGPAEKLEALDAARPAPDSVVAVVNGALAALRDYVARRDLVTVPERGACRAVEMPPFMWGFAAINPPGPFEEVADEALYYVKTTDPSWSDAERDEQLSLFNPWNLAVISIHEAYPGHFVQALVTRDITRPIRKINWDYAYGEGWAHYVEQLMLDEGFGAEDPRYKFAQLREALIRLCRYVVAIRMHTKGMSVEDAAKLFRKKAFMEPAAALEEAKRGAFDPGYLNYTLGKMAILKLREDWKALRPSDYSAREFHDRFLSYGPIPIPIIRTEMLGSNSGTLF